MSAAKREADLGGFALHGDQASEPILGRLVERGLHDELKGAAYAIIDGVDGRTHHLVFSDLEMTGDAKPGAIVEARAYSAPVWHDALHTNSLSITPSAKPQTKWAARKPPSRSHGRLLYAAPTTSRRPASSSRAAISRGSG